MLDNGAFTVWKQGSKPDWNGYYKWARRWLQYPTTWAVIPDVIDGDEDDNDALIKEWPLNGAGFPVWHLHESLDRLKRLCDYHAKVCFGSSKQYATIGSPSWHRRMCQAFNEIQRNGIVGTWIHMLRGMAATRLGYPFASVDSTDIARNHHVEGNNARRMADIWDSIQCSPKWDIHWEQPALVQG